MGGDSVPVPAELRRKTHPNRAVLTDATPTGDTIELGLRAKVRFNESGFPENTFNPEDVGVYDIYLKMISYGTLYAHTHIQVHVSCGEPVATEASTWGQLKSLYR